MTGGTGARRSKRADPGASRYDEDQPRSPPRLRQRQLAYVVRVLLEEFEKKTERGTQAWTRGGRILKIVLFGSFARGDFVDSPQTNYLSDSTSSSWSTTRN